MTSIYLRLVMPILSDTSTQNISDVHGFHHKLTSVIISGLLQGLGKRSSAQTANDRQGEILQPHCGREDQESRWCLRTCGLSARVLWHKCMRTSNEITCGSRNYCILLSSREIANERPATP